jgi:hypothetical protein
MKKAAKPCPRKSRCDAERLRAEVEVLLRRYGFYDKATPDEEKK